MKLANVSTAGNGVIAKTCPPARHWVISKICLPAGHWVISKTCSAAWHFDTVSIITIKISLNMIGAVMMVIGAKGVQFAL